MKDKILFFSFVFMCMNAIAQDKIDGITYVAPPRPSGEESIKRFAKTNADWITFVPYAFQNSSQTEINFNTQRQWWGERADGIIECIKMSKKNNLKVMLKPQIWLRGTWIGELDYKTDSEWLAWEKSYRDYIMFYTKIAIDQKVEMLCIGTEIRNSAKKRPKFWKELISEIRSKYAGKLTYSANWDDYHSISFWPDLDFVGISAYFPLSEQKTPVVSALVKKWDDYKGDLSRFSKRYKKQILFTEYGYLTIDGCAGKTWELEKIRRSSNINEQAQSNAFEALYTSFWKETWWAGGFVWKWFPQGMGHEGQAASDYCPQGKLAEKTIAKWYGSE
jgi:hypothetical protein